MDQSAEARLATGLLGTFADFVTELRAAGVPVSTTEMIDAIEALQIGRASCRERV